MTRRNLVATVLFATGFSRWLLPITLFLEPALAGLLDVWEARLKPAEERSVSPLTTS